MKVEIPDDILRAAGWSERDVLVELACRLFESEKIELPDAARLAGLDRVAVEGELKKRGIAPYRYTADDLELDLRSLARRQVRQQQRKGA
ncbi:MAG TPA: UPF0175 family protein [Phycisphaerales bacterium]|nr:UPF0175 family protein [Phycisphaerales bacterium]